MKKFDVAQLVSIGGLILAGVAGLLTNWSNEKQMERIIDEKIEERFANNQEEEES